MHLTFKQVTTINTNNTAIFLFEDAWDLDGSPLLEIMAPIIKNKEFKAKYLAKLPLRTDNGWLILIGLGPKNKITRAKVLEGAACASICAEERNITHLTLALPTIETMPPTQVLTVCALGALLAQYKQVEFKSKAPSPPSLASLTFVATQEVETADELLSEIAITAKNVCLARSLGDCPGNILSPEVFAQKATALAHELPLTVEVLDESALNEARLGLIVAVGQGSRTPPRLLKIKYEGAGSDDPLVLVGKGVTFDSGGISLKPAGAMEGMKTDMAGAATVLAVILAAAELKLP
ncbi:MAG: leucyl aminopeptidase family protein, partial [Candidatus Adiutrix sp.]